jgi:hypothetical protein
MQSQQNIFQNIKITHHSIGGNMHIYLMNGFYLGFISGGYLYSRDGICLGWIEDDKFVWDLEGKFRGSIYEYPQNKQKYIIKRRFGLPPLSRPSRGSIPPVSPLAPPENIKPIDLGVEIIDGFTL